MQVQQAKFDIGQVIKHRLFDYRGVIFDIDPRFCGTEAWYQQMAKSRPPKDQPWYRVLVDGAIHDTYVAERNLATDDSGQRIVHPLIDELFDGFQNGAYYLERRIN